MADITLTFEAIGAEQIVAEVKKIRDALKDVTKGLNPGAIDPLASAAKDASKAAESLAGKLDSVDDELDDVEDGADDAAGKLRRLSGASGSVKSGFLSFNPAMAAAGVALAAVAAAAAAAKKAFDFLADGIMDAFKTGAQFAKMAAALGTDAGSARVLAQAFAEAGMSAESVVPMVSKMQRKIAEGSAAFKALGLDVEALRGQTALEQMQAIGDAVRKVGDQTGKMKVLMAIFEEAGPQLSMFFDNPKGLENASRTLGSSVGIMQDNAAAFERASTLISNISVKIGTFFEGVAAGVVGPLNAVLEALNGIDLAAIGERFGKVIEDTVALYYKAFTNGSLFELIYTKLASAITGGAATLGRELVKSLARNLSIIHGLIGGTWDWMTGDDDKSFSEHFKANYDLMQKEVADAWDSSAGDWLNGMHEKWKEQEEALIRSINRAVPDEALPWNYGKNKTPPPKKEVPGEKLDLSGLVKDKDKGKSSMSFTPQSDALMRVGGSIGGMAGAQLAPARKTADNTSRLVNLTNEIRSTLKVRPSGAVATYA